ncbi:Alpha/Beta hydrolase protein [Paraphysoderma sedebokerense]|nr:Alpha/Beta hydrolase protein [Paraphysoderma sedebokerense]
MRYWQIIYLQFLCEQLIVLVLFPRATSLSTPRFAVEGTDHFLGKRSWRKDLVEADEEFVRRAQIIGLANSISSCATGLVQSWTHCSRCQEYAKTIAKSKNRTIDSSSPPEGFRIISNFHMQSIEQRDSGYIAIQHATIDAATKYTHPLSKSIVISMPGASSIGDWFDIFDAKESKLSLPGWEGAKVYDGLLDGFHKIWGQMKPVISQAHSKYPDYKVVVTGYSRSAPIAVITTVFIIEELKIPVSLVEGWAFGSPRFVSLRFNQILLKKRIKIFNVMNEGDPLSKISPEWWGFYHVPREIFLTNRTLDLKTGKELSFNQSSKVKTYVCDDTFGTEDPRCIDRVPLRTSMNIDRHLRFQGWGLSGVLKLGFFYSCDARKQSNLT